jgi:hypothetical protein
MNKQDKGMELPREPGAEETKWDIPTGGPEHFGFPQNPTLQQRECWRNQERFLAAFAQCCRVCKAAEAVGLTVWAVERWQKTDLYGFVKRMEVAEQVYVEALEQEADRRGVEGIDKPVYYKGEKVDTIREYSDNLLMFRLKKLRPEYRDNYQIVLPDTTPLQMIELMRSIGQGTLGWRQPGQVVEGEVKELEEGQQK